MERQRSSARKRRPPSRYMADDIISTTDDVEGMNAEDIQVVQTTAQVHSEPSRPPPKRQRDSTQGAAAVQRKTGMGSLYRLFRRTVGVLSAKIDQLKTDVNNTKATVQNLEVASTSNSAPKDTRSNAPNAPTGNLPEPQGSDADAHCESNTTGLTSNEVKTVVYNIRNLNVEKPTFGTNNKHPVTFLEELESYLKKAAKEANELDLVQECLVEDARNWANVYKGRWKNLGDFKADFLATYWGENEQSELRRRIVQGSWDKQETPSMLTYFLRFTSRAGLLNYKIPEKQLVADLMRHFPKYIQQVWANSDITTIIGTAEFLRNMDSINKQDPHVYSKKSSQPNSTNFEKKKRDFQQEYRTWTKPSMPQNSRTQAVNSIEEARTSSRNDAALN
ncbi:hypothetical protein NE865_14900 [Phthorimaea operculella]|nr:hypothetical protein NE865_14900 [Phthorimaea operculella]